MTKEEFEVLQLELQQSDKSIKEYLHGAGVNYSTYNHWRKKMTEEESPNGIRAHFGSGTEDVLRELLDKSLMSHVLPE